MNTIDISTSMYYTFSTIAQVLAGFLALSGVFLLFQLKHFVKKQNILFSNYIKYYPDSLESNFAKELIIHAELENFSTISNRLLKKGKDASDSNFTNNDAQEKAKMFGERLKQDEQKKLQLINITKAAFIIGILFIIYSLLILANIPCIITNFLAYTTYIFYLGILGTLLAILLIVLGIFRSLNSIKPKIAK